MAVAHLSAARSKDPHTQVGCCIVNIEKRIVAVGYNGLIEGLNDDKINWASQNDDILKTKYPYIVHAEQNAILNAVTPIKNCVLYTTHYPCNECAKIILQAKIAKVIYYEYKYDENHPAFNATKHLFALKKTLLVKINNFTPPIIKY